MRGSEPGSRARPANARQAGRAGPGRTAQRVSRRRSGVEEGEGLAEPAAAGVHDEVDGTAAAAGMVEELGTADAEHRAVAPSTGTMARVTGVTEPLDERLEGTNYFKEILAENRGLIDEIGGDAHSDEVDIEAIIDEVGRPVAELASSLASSTWFPSWEKDTYAIAELAACLRKLRAQQDHDLATLKDRAENEGSNLRSRFRQQRGRAE